MQMLHENLPADDSEKSHVQAARAFACARDYMNYLSDFLDDPSPYINSPQIHPGIARSVMEEQSYVMQSSDKIIFFGMKDRNHLRYKVAGIDDGVARPLNKWKDFPAYYTMADELLRASGWQKQVPDVWTTEPKELPRIRMDLDLSSLSLFHQGKPVKSLEVMHYYTEKVDEKREEEEETRSRRSESLDSRDSETSSGGDVKSLDGERIISSDHSDSDEENFSYSDESDDFSIIRFITSKLITQDGETYYTLASRGNQDLGNKIAGHVKPFLSGIQCEKDCSGQSMEQEEDDYWQKQDLHWRLSEEVSRHYHVDIYPAMSHHVEDAVKQRVEKKQKQGKKEITILDIVGGNGDLAELIIKNVQAYVSDPDLHITYRLVDYSPEDVDLANERFRTLGLKNVTATAVCRNMFDYKFDVERMKADKDIGIPPQGVDVVVSCGGLVNNVIIGDVATAQKFGRMFIGLMDVDAFGVFSGHTNVVVNKEQFKKSGARVLNCYNEYSRQQVYGVQRLPEGADPFADYS